jgi:hypothetical protein
VKVIIREFNKHNKPNVSNILNTFGYKSNVKTFFSSSLPVSKRVQDKDNVSTR